MLFLSDLEENCQTELSHFLKNVAMATLLLFRDNNLEKSIVFYTF